MINSLWHVEKRDKSSFVRCIACARRCLIPSGSAGFCGVRVNNGGKLDLLVYGRPAAVWPDPIEKKPLFHVLPGTKSYSLGTYGCNFACVFCQNWELSQISNEYRERYGNDWLKYLKQRINEIDYKSPNDIVDEALALNCPTISFTYIEPTIFTEYAYDIMLVGKKHGLRFVYVTNGYESKETWKLLKGNLMAANIDLKSFSDDFYIKYTSARLEPVKESILLAKKYGIWVEITTLLIPGLNDSEREIKEAADWVSNEVGTDVPWHFTAFFPHYKLRDIPPTPPETLIKAMEIAKSYGMKFVYIGNVGYTYQNYESTYCPYCGTLLIKRTGFISSDIRISDGKCNNCKKPIPGIWK